MGSILYPEDRVAPEEPAKADHAALCELAKTKIRDAVPRGGAAKTYDELVRLVRATDTDGCHALWPEEVVRLIDEVKAERPAESQLDFAEVALEPVGGDGEVEEIIK